jgi:hypothetical protein
VKNRGWLAAVLIGSVMALGSFVGLTVLGEQPDPQAATQAYDRWMGRAFLMTVAGMFGVITAVARLLRGFVVMLARRK